jgi:hypothetical protein
VNCGDWSRCFLTLLLLSPYRTPPLRHPVAVQASNRERFANAVVQYDWVNNSRGERLRTFVTRPKGTSGKVPVIFFVGWLSCDSMEYPNGAGHDGFGALMLRLIDESGYATVRMNKPGVAESEGDCAKTNFKDELEGWQAAFDSMSQYDFIDLDRVFIFGLSNGGGFSPSRGEIHRKPVGLAFRLNDLAGAHHVSHRPYSSARYDERTRGEATPHHRRI